MVSFLKSRKKKSMSEVGGASSDPKVGGALSGPAMETEVPAADESGVYEASRNSAKPPRASPRAGQEVNPKVKVHPPGGWLHMDVLEKDKLEWTTDVPATPPNPQLDRTETRFSLNGLVIPRTVTTIPSHMGLHHHGNEPQVRCGPKLP